MVQEGHGMDPIEIKGGPNAGDSALPLRLRYADEFESQRVLLNTLAEVQLDDDVAFPSAPFE
jgi:hypothetical protein